VQRILSAANVHIGWEEMPMRADVERKGGNYLTDFIFPSIEKNRVALKGRWQRLL